MKLDLRTALTVVGILLIAGVSSTASAQRVYTMSGNLDRLNRAPGGTIVKQILNAGSTVMQTGSAPAQLTIPASAFATTGTSFRVFPTIATLAQLISSFTSQNLVATMAAGGGPATASTGGTVGFCWPIGTTPNPLNPGCLSPAQGVGQTGVMRAIPIAGKSQFGGTFKLLQKRAGSIARAIAFTPALSLRISPFTNTRTELAGAGNGNGTAASPFTGPEPARAGAKIFVGGLLDATSGHILSPGVQVGGTLPPPPVALGMGMAMTTGKVTAKDLVPVPTTQTTTGTDSRTPLGSGMITLIGGSVNWPASNPNMPFERIQRLTMNLPEPAATAGLAAGLACLLGLAWVRGKRH